MLTSLKKFLERKFLRRIIINYYNNLPKEKVTQEESQVVDYLKSNKLFVFPYSFSKKYKASDIIIHKDEDQDLYYMIYNEKRLYYKNGKRKKKAQKYFNSILMEQDIKSPHRYLTSEFNINHNDIVVDIGAAEGIFSLDIIHKAKKVYLFETDPVWKKALEATFTPWKNKVEIILKGVSDKNNENYVTLDTFFSDKEGYDCVKIDVEGVEQLVLDGMKQSIMQDKKQKIVVCTYHQQNDEISFTRFFKKYGFQTSLSKGFMIFRKNIEKPYLRRGLIYTIKT
jgi:precorrin-6B methylase 2